MMESMDYPNFMLYRCHHQVEVDFLVFVVADIQIQHFLNILFDHFLS